jgi:hypothetical protein
MSNHQEFSPASLRLIKRKYGSVAEVAAPDTDPSLALQAFNTSSLQDGALGVAYASQAGGTNHGYPRLFMFKRGYSGPPENAQTSFTPIVGGGLWVQLAGMNMVQPMSVFNDGGGGITMTAGGGATVLNSHTGVGLHQSAGFGSIGNLVARVLVTTGAVAGSNVSLLLQTSVYTGAPTWATQDSIGWITMLANQHLELNLRCGFSMAPGDLLAARIVGEATAQDAVCTSSVIWWDSTVIPFGY